MEMHTAIILSLAAAGAGVLLAAWVRTYNALVRYRNDVKHAAGDLVGQLLLANSQDAAGQPEASRWSHADLAAAYRRYLAAITRERDVLATFPAAYVAKVHGLRPAVWEERVYRRIA